MKVNYIITGPITNVKYCTVQTKETKLAIWTTCTM